MIHLGLIGYPLGHSLSPKLHMAALSACELEGEYSLFPVHPHDKQGLADILSRIRKGEITGLNVTIPHKQNVIELLDELAPTAQSVGAVNTIYMKQGKLLGDNTDAPGFLLDLKRFLTTETQSHGNLNALVIGAGGSARAVVYALLEDGWKITLAARRLQQAQHLADSLTTYPTPITVTELPSLTSNNTSLQSPISSTEPTLKWLAARRKAGEKNRCNPTTSFWCGTSLSLIVNTTPIGMSPHIDQSPWPANLPLPPHAAIYDLVYNPRETKLLAAARAQGLPTANGLGMLIEQAALAFQIWTGLDPSREAMFKSINQSPITNH